MDVRVERSRARVDARLIAAHDAAIVIATPATAEAALARLPSAALWPRLHKDARARGSVQTLCMRTGESTSLMSVALFTAGASAFERLTLAGRAWKDIASATPGRVLLIASDDADPRDIEAALAAVLAGSAPLP